jgi:predicted DNA repair protein MutK
MTVGVYGIVAGIVKLDDVGLYLAKLPGTGAWPRLRRWVGGRIVNAAPPLMKLLGVAGTLAMFLVGGGILVHGIPPLHHWVEQQAVPAALLNCVAGVAAGAVALAVVSLLQRLRQT